VPQRREENIFEMACAFHGLYLMSPRGEVLVSRSYRDDIE